MIKEVLQQLEPLDAQIDALSGADDGEMLDLTAHAAELAELAAQEDALLQRCTALTPEDRVFLARRPDRPHIDEIIDNLFTDFFEQCGDRQCKEVPIVCSKLLIPPYCSFSRPCHARIAIVDGNAHGTISTAR